MASKYVKKCMDLENKGLLASKNEKGLRIHATINYNFRIGLKISHFNHIFKQGPTSSKS